MEHYRFMINYRCIILKIIGYFILLFILIHEPYSQVQETGKFDSLDSLSHLQYELYKSEKVKGNYLKALEHIQQYALFSDSVVVLQRQAQLREINSRYENDKKQQELNLLIQDNKLKDLKINQNRFVIFGISGLVILVWMIIFMVIRQRRLRANQQAMALEQALLRSQMNPHFIFNTLTNIQSFVIRNETDLANKYLDHFSGMIGSILENSDKKVVSLTIELEIITNYFKLQQLRYGEKLGYNIMVDPTLETELVMVPPMMVQPLIENAIDHGIKPKEGPGRVDVRFRKLDAGLWIEVEDDGVGRNYMKTNPGNESSQHAGLALVILKERLDSFKTGRMEIQDLSDADGQRCGTIVRLFLPLIVIDS